MTRKTRTYRLNVDIAADRVRVAVNDKFLLKKYSREWSEKMLGDVLDSPVDPRTRSVLVDDLYHVGIKKDAAAAWLRYQFESGEIDEVKYSRNLHSVDCVDSGHLFYKFDTYGRLHTNFTVLKKHIRQNFLNIDGMCVDELDIKNSQPLFLGVLMRREGVAVEGDVATFIDTVNSGLLYDSIVERNVCAIPDRHEAKMLVYRVLFGKNFDRCKDCHLFGDMFPSVMSFIRDYKSSRGNYKLLSHELQRLESEFIFGSVVEGIKSKFPHVRLFTVHDSIVFPSAYREEVGAVFRSEFKRLVAG